MPVSGWQGGRGEEQGAEEGGPLAELTTPNYGSFSVIKS